MQNGCEARKNALCAVFGDIRGKTSSRSALGSVGARRSYVRAV